MTCQKRQLINSSVTQAGQVKCDDLDKKEHSGPPGWGLGVGMTTTSWKKTYVQKTSEIPRRMEAPYEGGQGPEGVVAP